MKRTAVLVLIIHYISISDSRLIKKVTEAKPLTISSTSDTPVRLRRFLAFDDSVALDSKDEHSDETVYENDLKKSLPKPSKTRFTRNSNATTIDASKFQPANEIKVLVKKPIPKFTELDEYELEPKAYRILPRFVESDELEDEDFNVDDYDFDVKHDEFAGRGKPLVPRLKDKEKTLAEPPIPELKIADAIPPANVQPTLHNTSKTPVTSKQRSIHKGTEKSKDKKDEYYDYEITTKNVDKNKVEENSDETDESKEFHRTALRRARSPWHEQMLPSRVTVKSISQVPKHIAVLPMFPASLAYRSSNPE